jgi:glycogen synthase
VGRQAKVVLTIHNMDNTGECKTEELDWTGLNGEELVNSFSMRGVHPPGLPLTPHPNPQVRITRWTSG